MSVVSVLSCPAVMEENTHPPPKKKILGHCGVSSSRPNAPSLHPQNLCGSHQQDVSVCMGRHSFRAHISFPAVAQDQRCVLRFPFFSCNFPGRYYHSVIVDSTWNKEARLPSETRWCVKAVHLEVSRSEWGFEVRKQGCQQCWKQTNADHPCALSGSKRTKLWLVLFQILRVGGAARSTGRLRSIRQHRSRNKHLCGDGLCILFQIQVGGGLPFTFTTKKPGWLCEGWTCPVPTLSCQHGTLSKSLHLQLRLLWMQRKRILNRLAARPLRSFSC